MVWPFTSNVRRENGQKKYINGNKNINGRQKNRWESAIRNYMKKLKIKNWTSCIQDRNNWKLYVEKAKTFND